MYLYDGIQLYSSKFPGETGTLKPISITDFCNSSGSQVIEIFLITKPFQYKIYIPDLIMDKRIRDTLNNPLAYYSLSQTYQILGLDNFMPAADIRPCISQVMRAATYDFDTFTMRYLPGQKTCTGFFECMKEWTDANRPEPDINTGKRRLKIDGSVYAPSPLESDCIIKNLMQGKGLVESYSLCGCSSILPTWPGAIDMIQEALIKNPYENLYLLLKSHFRLFNGIAPPVTIPTYTDIPTITPITTTVIEKPSNALLLLILGSSIYLLLKK